MSSVTASYDALVAQVNKGEVSADVMQKVAMLVDNLGNRNFPGATQIQAVSICSCVVVANAPVDLFYFIFYAQDLANTVWNQHKDWIKGIKILIQLASKK